MKGAAKYWPFLRTTYYSLLGRTVSLPLHPNLRQSDIIGGVNIGIILQILVFNFFLLLEYVTHGPKFHHHKILYFDSKSTEFHTPAIRKTLESWVVAD